MAPESSEFEIGPLELVRADPEWSTVRGASLEVGSDEGMVDDWLMRLVEGWE